MAYNEAKTSRRRLLTCKLEERGPWVWTLYVQAPPKVPIWALMWLSLCNNPSWPSLQQSHQSMLLFPFLSPCIGLQKMHEWSAWQIQALSRRRHLNSPQFAWKVEQSGASVSTDCIAEIWHCRLGTISCDAPISLRLRLTSSSGAKPV